MEIQSPLCYSTQNKGKKMREIVGTSLQAFCKISKITFSTCYFKTKASQKKQNFFFVLFATLDNNLIHRFSVTK